jgi:hypothetical protein
VWNSCLLVKRTNELERKGIRAGSEWFLVVAFVAGHHGEVGPALDRWFSV